MNFFYQVTFLKGHRICEMTQILITFFPVTTDGKRHCLLNIRNAYRGYCSPCCVCCKSIASRTFIHATPKSIPLELPSNIDNLSVR